MIEQSSEFLQQSQNLAAEVSLSGLSVTARQRIIKKEGGVVEGLDTVTMYHHPVVSMGKDARFAPKPVDSSDISDTRVS